MVAALQRNNFTNLNIKDLELLTSCDACDTGKIRKANRPKEATRRPTKFGHTIRSHAVYSNISVDEATRWSFVKLLKRISHATSL